MKREFHSLPVVAISSRNCLEIVDRDGLIAPSVTVCYTCRMRAPIAIAVPLLWAATSGAEAQQPKPGPSFASAVGVVVDSVHGGPLKGALVVVDGTDAQATVDDRGVFRIDSIPPGTYQIGVFHPLLDSLGVAVGTGKLTFDSGSKTSIVLATPSVASIIALYCTEDERQHGAGAIIGHVTIADSDAPATAATVRYTWRSVIRDNPVLEAHVMAGGVYHVCGVPLGARGMIRAEQSGVVTGEVPAEVATRPLAIVPLHLPLARVANSEGAVVSGRVVDTHGVPISHVDVIADSATRTLTTDSGAFTLRGLASGSRALEFRKVGFRAIDVAVDLSTSKPASVHVVLDPAPPVLATIDVTASRQKALDRVGFTARARSSAGTFLTASDIDSRNPQTFSDLARTVSGLRVKLQNGQFVVTQPAGESYRGNGCVLYEVDGVAFTDDPPGAIDGQLQPATIIGMEVYRPGAAPLQVLQDATPGDFGVASATGVANKTTAAQSQLQAPGTTNGLGAVSTTSCTVVVIWTKATSRGN
jgi:hypothetical protein